MSAGGAGDFGLKTNKSAQSLAPAVGAAIPGMLKAHALPPPLTYEFKGQVLIINPMTRKIVDMFAET